MKKLAQLLAVLACTSAIAAGAQGQAASDHVETKSLLSSFRPGGLWSIPIGSVSKKHTGYVLQRAQAYDLCLVHKSSGAWQCATLDAPYVPVAELFAAPDAGVRRQPVIGLRLHSMPDWTPSDTDAVALADRLAVSLDAARDRLLGSGGQHHKSLNPDDDDPSDGPIVLEPIEIVGSGTVGGDYLWYWDLEDVFNSTPVSNGTVEQCKRDCDNKYEAASAICRRQSSSRARAACWARAAVIYAACLYKCG